MTNDLKSIIDSSEKTIASIDDILRSNLRLSVEKIKPDYVDLGSTWIPAIMVTSNWNANDDVFSPEETLKAAITVLNKPVNWQHNGEEEDNETIGVITNYLVLDENYLPISETSSKNKYHILVGMLVWDKYFPTYAEKIAEQISDNVLFVSMECLSKNYGYALRKEGSDSITLIDKTENTSRLDNYLRKNKGTGKINLDGQNYLVGKWLKNIVFSGIGFVNKPANKESIIIPEVISQNSEFEDSNNSDLFKLVAKNSVLNNIEVQNMSEANTAKESATVNYEAQLAELNSAKEVAEKALAEANAKIKSMEDSYASEKAEAEKQMAKMKEDKECAEKALAEAKDSAKQVAEAFDKAKAEVVDYKAQVRLTEMKSFGAVDQDEVKALELYKAMSDDAYNAAKTVAATMFKKATEQTVTSNTKSTDNTVTNFTPSTKAAEELEKVEAKNDVNIEVAATKTTVSNATLEKFVKSVLDKKQGRR
jgi:hypothetical protein